MNLQSFVEQALAEIRFAYEGAQKKILESGMLVPPQYGSDSSTVTTKVEFDVAVEASSEDSTKGGGGIKVKAGVIDIGGKGETGISEKESSVSRVKFTIPLLLPPPVGAERKAK